MSITSALTSALSGLAASSRAAGVVSSNLANVLTDGYAVRDIELITQVTGGGVRVAGTTRHLDQGLLADRRLADSALAGAETRTQFVAGLEQAVGQPDDGASLTARLAAFEASLVTAASQPENEARLQAAVLRAGEVTGKLNAISDHIQAARTQADAEIARAVDQVNTSLSEIADVNIQITRARARGQPSVALEDHRQAAIDRLAEFLPLREVPRDNGALALYTPGGAILLDGSMAQLEFTPANVVAPHMTLGNGLLSGLQINGTSVRPWGEGSPVEGGRLAALFEIRDGLAVDAQAQIDAVARDLIERFQDPGLDSTRAPGDPGLLTDAGALLDPSDEVGLAGRISLSAVVDPGQGGEVWRLRDGLGAAAQGPVGDAALLQDLQAALQVNRGLGSGNLGATARGASGHVGNLLSHIGQDRLTLEQSLSFATGRQAELRQMELGNGVDTDAQMQRLLLIEQAYSANARMIQTVDDMMQTLLRI